MGLKFLGTPEFQINVLYTFIKFYIIYAVYIFPTLHDWKIFYDLLLKLTCTTQESIPTPPLNKYISLNLFCNLKFNNGVEHNYLLFWIFICEK